MESRTRIKEIRPVIDGAEITLYVKGDTEQLNELADKDLKMTLVRYREKRSGDANRYFHLLSDKLADAMRMSKPKMKNYLLFHYGQKVRDAENNLVVIKTNADEEELICRSDIHCWYIKDAPDGTPMYVLLEHSRFYDSLQMSILLDGVIAECKVLGIATETPDEIARMKALWEQHEQHSSK